MSDAGFLSRWSRRKHEARRPEPAPAEPAVVVPPVVVPAVADSEPAPVAPLEPAPLPPVESLTPESDFAPFMRPDVEPGLRQQALKTLFADPRFNVMDGLDVYIDDYSKPDPLPEGWLEKMNQVVRLGEYRAPEAVDEAEAEPLPGVGTATVEQGPAPATSEPPAAGEAPRESAGEGSP